MSPSLGVFRATLVPCYLYGLQLADGGSERGAFVRVVCGTVQRRLSDTQSLSCNADPAAVQGLLKDTVKIACNRRNLVNGTCSHDTLETLF